ncbi:uncharacterized protein LOC131949839 [Physella acuta]|uniref:uncharacterized protein LOC131949839 n=1 Tax=Physella acuta TaxID=109671 RepID=UPI0027DC664F|nr:uncharacterized protein LOC131949839 [Physella acuta]XP_059167834.1 uncharacterized protein LOC131949839 [Physella acuta]
MDGILDVHICGACRLEFSDIFQFINHKKECYLSNMSSLQPSVNSLDPDKKMTQFSAAGARGQICYSNQSDVPSGKKSSVKQKSNRPRNVTTTLPLSSTPAGVSHSLLSLSSHSTTQPGHKKSSSRTQNNLTQITEPGNECLYKKRSSTRHVKGISTDDIAVYVVSPNSFASSIKDECDRLDSQKHLCSRNLWSVSTVDHNSCTQDLYTSNLPKPQGSCIKTEDFTSHSQFDTNHSCGIDTPLSQHSDRVQIFTSDVDVTSDSHGSTPCPEDLEVGQISAAMLGRKITPEMPRSLMGLSQNVSTVSQASDSISHKVPDYIRENTASAPIMNVDAKTRRRVSVEKRERLQGVSDDLLSCSPLLEFISDPSSKKCVSKMSSSNRNLIESSQQANQTQPMAGYKAIFTSPSSAGHRLAPTIADQPSALDEHPIISHAQKSSRPLVYKNISASAKSASCRTRLQSSAALKLEKTEKKSPLHNESSTLAESIYIDRDACPMLIPSEDVSYQSAGVVNSEGNLLMNSVSSLEFNSGAPVYLEAQDLLNDGGETRINPSTAFHLVTHKPVSQKMPTASLVYQTIPTDDISKSKLAILSHGNDTIGLYSPTTSASYDENSVIILVKNSDGSILMLPKCSDQPGTLLSEGNIREGSSLDAGSVFAFATGQNMYPSNGLTQQLGNEPNTYICVTQNTAPEVAIPQYLFRNLATVTPPFPHFITVPGESVVGNSTGAYVITQPTHTVVEENQTPVAKIKETKPLVVEREKCIRKPRKVTGSAQPSTVKNSSADVNVKKQPAPQNVLGETPEVASTVSEDKQEIKKDQVFICKVDKCSYKTTVYKDFQRHYRIHTGEKPFQCKDCDKSFNRSDKLKIHSRFHEGIKPFKCHLCSYATVDGGSLKKHMRIHTGERPFKCQICSHASRNSSQLVVHLRTHTGDSPFHCNTCSAKFKINSDLKRHMRIHTGEKPYKCEFCDYKSSNGGNLKNHVKFNHSKENEISCSECDFVTSSRKRLKEHSKLHDPKQMIKCQQCDYTCTSLNALRSHNSIHLSVKPYRCNYCTFTSKQSGSLKKHVQTQHIDKMLAAAKGKKSTAASLGNNLLKENKAAREKVDERRARGNVSCYKRVHVCKECGSSFVREDSLRSHMKQHGQGENNAPLEQKQDQFSTHQATKTGTQPGTASKLQGNPDGKLSDNTNVSVSEPVTLTQKSTGHDTSGFPELKTEDGSEDLKACVPQESTSLPGGQQGGQQKAVTHLPWEHRSYTLSVSDKEKSSPQQGTSSENMHAPSQKRKSTKYDIHGVEPLANKNQSLHQNVAHVSPGINAAHAQKRRKHTGVSPQILSPTPKNYSTPVILSPQQPACQTQIFLQQPLTSNAPNCDLSSELKTTLILTNQNFCHQLSSPPNSLLQFHPGAQIQIVLPSTSIPGMVQDSKQQVFIPHHDIALQAAGQVEAQMFTITENHEVMSSPLAQI